MKARLSLLLLFWFPLIVAPGAALAQSRAAGNGFDITAQNGIRFNADAGAYVASGEVQLVAGDWVVLADSLTARLDSSRSAVGSVEAEGQVYIQRDNLKAQASRVLIRPADAVIELRGTPTNIQLGEDRLVAQGAVVLNQTSGEVQVQGDFVLVVGEIQLSGQTARGSFADNALRQFEAGDDVRIEGDGWLAAAERLSLDRESNALSLEGSVALQQGSFVLSGTRVDYNLATGSLSIDGQDNGRIRGALKLE